MQPAPSDRISPQTPSQTPSQTPGQTPLPSGPRRSLSAVAECLAEPIRRLRRRLAPPRRRSGAAGFAGRSACLAETLEPRTLLAAEPVGGLSLTFFNSDDLTGAPAGTAHDSDARFNKSGSPQAGVAADFSTRFEGYLTPAASANYRFRIYEHNDSVRLWVDGQLLIDHWGDTPQTGGTSGWIGLSRDEPVRIKIEHADRGGRARMILRIQRQGQTFQHIEPSRLTSERGGGFGVRRQLAIDEYARRDPGIAAGDAVGLTGNKSTWPIATAKFEMYRQTGDRAYLDDAREIVRESIQLELDGRDGRGVRNRNRSDVKPHDEGFRLYRAMDTFVRFEQYYTRQMRVDMREMMQGATSYGAGLTQNHQMKFAVARILAQKEWANGWTAAQDFRADDPTGLEYFRQRAIDDGKYGSYETNSSAYAAINMAPLVTMAQYAEAYGDRNRARKSLDLWFLRLAESHLGGHFIKANTRDQQPAGWTQADYSNTGEVAWMAGFDMPARRYDRPDFDRRHAGGEGGYHIAFALAAEGAYRIPPAILGIANNRADVHNLTTTQSQRPGFAFRSRQVSYIDRTYGLYSMAIDNEVVGTSDDQTRRDWSREQLGLWGVKWLNNRDVDADSTFTLRVPSFMGDPSDANNDGGDGSRGNGPYIQVFQHRKSLIGTIDIPADLDADDPRRRIVLHTPTNHLAAIDESGDSEGDPGTNIYLHYDGVLIAFHMNWQMTWSPRDATASRDGAGRRIGFAVETERPDAVDGDTPEQRLANFRNLVRNRFRNMRVEKASATDDRPRVIYQARIGRQMRLQYRRPDEGGAIRALYRRQTPDSDVMVVDRVFDVGNDDHWGGLRSRWTSQAADSNLVRIDYFGTVLEYDTEGGNRPTA